VAGLFYFEESMNQKNKTFAAAQIKSVDITDAQWEKVKSFMVSPEKFNREDVRVFEGLLAHNFIDRDKERFSKPTLQSLADTIVGKQVLMHHEKWSDGVGRFVDSRLEKMSLDQTMQVIGAHPDKKIREKLARIEQADGGLYWMVVDYYMSANNPKVREIELGIIGDMSISFKPVAMKEIRADEKDRYPMWLEYQDTEDESTEAIEGSLVFLGAQNGARTRKDAGEDKFLSLLMDEFADVDPDKIKQVLTDTFKPKGNEMITLKMLGAEYVVEADKAETIEAVQTAVDSAVDAVKAEKDELTNKLAAAETERDALKAERDQAKAEADQAKADSAEAQKVLNEAKEYRESLIEETIKYGCLVDLIAQADVEAKKAAFDKLTVAELKEKLAEYKKIFDKLNPGKGVLGDTPVKSEPKNMNNYVAPVK
jgi:hypothetical protein